MRTKDVINLYEYGENFKEFKGEITLLEKKDDRWNQEYWEVEYRKNKIRERLWIAKPIEWYRPEDILPNKNGITEFVSIDVLVIGYDDIGRLKYQVTCFNYKDNKWEMDLDLEKVLYWKYLDNPPISLVKNVRN
jgi:hypothetical protein